MSGPSRFLTASLIGRQDSTAAQPLSPRYDRNGSGPSSRLERYIVTLPPAPGHSKLGGPGGCCRGLGAGR
jgi:hypothetical protein